MFSPALARRQQVLAAQSGAAQLPATPQEPDASTPAGQEYATLRVLLHDNLRTLSEIQSIEARNPKKREMAEAFAPWIEGALAIPADEAAPQDEILATVMIWAVDYGDLAYALRLATHLIAHGLVLPERYSRTPACFLAEQIAERTLADPAFATREQLLATQTLTEPADMPDQVRAKLAKALGRAQLAAAEAFDPAADNAVAGGKSALLEDATHWLTRAKTLDQKAGVTKDLEKVARLQKAAAQENGQ
jgi:hypothetical protein